MDYLEVLELSTMSKSISSKLLSINELKTYINNRELYIIDSKYSFDISSIIIKKKCILLKLDFIRAIVEENKIFIIDIKTDDFMVVKDNIKLSLENYDETKTFHLFFIDILYTEISNYFEKIISNITPQISNSIELIKNGNYVYKDFILLQSKLLTIEYKIKELKTMTEELLNNKDEIKELNFKNNIDLFDTTEEMIENYYLKFQDLLNDVGRLTREMDNAQKIVNIDLAKKRNNYAIFSIYISITSLSVSIGSFIGSMFGMNLSNKMESSNLAFILVFIFSLVVIFFGVKLQNYFFIKFQ